MKLKSNLYLIVFLLITLAVSCTKHEEQSSRHTLEEAAQHIENDPKQALAMLKSVETDALSQADYRYYTLLKIRVYWLTGSDIASSLTSATKAMEYFTQHNNAEKSAFACFIVGRIYERQKDLAKALHYYMKADEWAAKANYSIKNFNYNTIPYNIARLLNSESRYEESLNYCKKRLEHLSSNSKYTHQLYTLELMALNHQKNSNFDTSLMYYNKALAIATEHNNLESKYRTTYNKIMLLRDIKEYDAAKAECYQLLPLITDTESLNKGKLHILLADIYNTSNNTDSASVNLYKARNLLNNTNNTDVATRLALYKRLDLVEQKKGNQSKAAEFKQQYNQLKEDNNNARKTETEELKSEISQMQANHLEELLAASERSWLQAQQQKKKARIAGYIIIAALCSTLIFFFRQKIAITLGNSEPTKTRKYQREILLNNKRHYENYAELTIQIEDLVYDRFESNALGTIANMMAKLHANNTCSAVIDIWQNSKAIETFQNNKKNKTELLKTVKDMAPRAYWILCPEFYTPQYEGVVNDINNNFNWLNETEKGTLCLMSIGLFNKDEMAHLLCLFEPEFATIEQLLEIKFTYKGLNLNDYLLNIQKAHNIKVINHKQPLYAYLYNKFATAVSSVKHNE